MSSEVSKKLDNFHVRGNIIGSLVNIAVASTAIFLQGDEVFNNPHWKYAYVCVCLGALFRILGSIFFAKELLNRKKGVIIFGLLGVTLLGTGWGYIFYVICSTYGIGSVNASYMLLVLAGVINAAGVSFRANKEQYFIFVTLISSLASLTYLTSSDTSQQYIVFYVICFYLLNILTYKLSSKQLRTSVEMEVKANFEKERFNRLINAVPGFVTILDEDLYYKEANNLTLSFYPDILGRKLGSYGTSLDYVHFVKDFASSKKEVETKEVTTEAIGKTLHFLMSLQRTSKNETVMVAIPMDELISARQELREQEAKVLYSAKLASLGEMAASVAHEVNNPLTIIQGLTSILQQMVEQEPMDKENIKNLTTKIVSTSERISKTIRSLKSLSRNGEKDPYQEMSLLSVVGQCLDICQHRFTLDDIELKLTNLDKDVIFKGSEVQMGQVFLNLLSNSLDAINASTEKERWIEICYTQEKDSLLIDVSDSGPGIPESIKEKVMEPFFTTKELGQGTGLGLSISKNIIRSHGGELILLPNTKFTTFRIQLPNS